MIKAIIFSNNSPILLDTFLQSVKEKEIQLFDFHILYRCDNNSKTKYLEVFEKNDITSYLPETSFKEDLLALLNKGNDELVAFFKDTNYFFSKFPEGNIEQIMENDDIFCFSLGLGKNITFCHANKANNILLNEVDNGENTFEWEWTKHYLDFGRPLELGAGHIFHSKEISKLFKKWNYNSIQGLEESFDNLDYYPKELMSSFKNSVLVDVISECGNPKEALESFDFNGLDKMIIEI